MAKNGGKIRKNSQINSQIMKMTKKQQKRPPKMVKKPKKTLNKAVFDKNIGNNPWPLLFIRKQHSAAINKPVGTKTSAKPAKNAIPGKVEVLANKKEFGNAIRRNRARRRIKEAYRAVKQESAVISEVARAQGVARPEDRLPNIKINAKIGALKADFKKIKEVIKKEIK